MKRRNFVKTTAAGSAFLVTSGAFAFSCSQSKRNISVNDDIQKTLDSAAPGIAGPKATIFPIAP
jgi:hypothetical protein